MMPLTFADSGQLLKIQKITGNDETRQHLATLGFVTGEEISKDTCKPHLYLIRKIYVVTKNFKIEGEK